MSEKYCQVGYLDERNAFIPYQGPFKLKRMYPVAKAGVPMGVPKTMWGPLEKLSQMDLGELVLWGSKLYAAWLLKLPEEPAVSDDQAQNSQNVLAYQINLARHAKRDEQARTLGELAKKLF